ncbi:unnamed protein product, partial [Enterobius vermicularis]|uniref:Neur_chan_memb domain-containing protein n=1 Tax=Enterobius vermicularis TaxID=51028 RepID=A0A0N4UXX3_ENTVE
GFTKNDIHYHWCELTQPNCSEPIRIAVDNITLPNYRLGPVCLNKTIATTTSGVYSRLRLQITLDRDSAFAVIQIYLPASMVVILTWISFWISSDSAPSRTTIGTMTVLTETHLLIGTNKRLPPVSYIKAVDVYLGGCYFFVVMVLIEYACVAYCRKKNEDMQKKNLSNQKTGNHPSQTPDLLRDTPANICTCQKAPRYSLARIIGNRPNKTCLKHSRIDYYSRFAFPAAVSEHRPV